MKSVGGRAGMLQGPFFEKIELGGAISDFQNNFITLKAELVPFVLWYFVNNDAHVERARGSVLYSSRVDCG